MAAREILAARAAGAPIDSSTVAVSDQQAYDVQSLVTSARLTSGERVVGWKLGYTSAAMREALGIQQPNAGPLTDAMVFTSPARLADRLQPRAEPEIAVVLDAEGAIAELIPALEIVDSVWRDYRFDWAHNTADGSSAAAAVLAAMPVYRGWLDDATVVLSNSSGEEARGRVIDQLPDLDVVVAWLGNLLRERGEVLAEASVVLTGGLLAPIDLPAGGWARARFAHPSRSFEDVVVEAHRPERNAS